MKTKLSAVPANLRSAVVRKKNDYSHYVDIYCTLTKEPDVKIWNELQEANPDLKRADIVKIALYALHSSLAK